MRAAVHTRYGPPDVVRVGEADRPSPGPREVLVRVHTSTVNRTDCGFRSGRPFLVRLFAGFPGPRVRIWGSEFAGVVEAAGDDVSRFGLGDRVFGYDDRGWGGHAEFKSIREDASIATIPANVTMEEAAAGTEGSQYALNLVRNGKVTGGSRVLVYGATGAIGSAAVQLIKALGGSVTAVCDTEHVELVRRLGADRVIDRLAEDFTKDAERYDVVIDAVGKSSFSRCKPLLRPRGIYMSTDLGPRGQNPILALVSPFVPGKKVKFPIPKAGSEIVEYLRGLMESGAFRPVIDRRYPLDQIVEAYRYVETGRKVGNVVIAIVGDEGHPAPPATRA